MYFPFSLAGLINRESPRNFSMSHSLYIEKELEICPSPAACI